MRLKIDVGDVGEKYLAKKNDVVIIREVAKEPMTFELIVSPEANPALWFGVKARHVKDA